MAGARLTAPAWPSRNGGGYAERWWLLRSFMARSRWSPSARRRRRSPLPGRTRAAITCFCLDDPLPGARAESAAPAAVSGEPSAGAAAGHASGARLAHVDRSSRSVATESTPGEGVIESAPVAPGPTDSAPNAPPGDGPQLSLDQLGVGTNPFLPRPGSEPTEKPGRSSRGFRRSMAESIAKRDQQVGLGPEGPILKRLAEEIRQSETAPNSKARFRARIDRHGKLVAFELLDATTDYRAWRSVAKRVLAALAGTELRVPKTGRGLNLDMSIDSRVQLPSGADPGLGVDLFGIPIKKGGGERAHRLSLLTIDPGGDDVEIKGPGGATIHVPRPPMLTIFRLGFDPVDIGANAQRVVHSHVDALWADDVPGDEAPPSAAAPATPPAATSSTQGEPR